MSDFQAAGDAYRRAARLAGEAGVRATNLCRAAYWFFWGHDYPRCRETATEALALAEAEGLPAQTARAQMFVAFVEIVQQGSRGLDAGTATRILKASEADDEFAAYAAHHVGQILEWSGEYPRAIELQERALVLAKRVGLGDLMIQTRWFLGKALSCTGEYQRALSELAGAFEFTDRIGDRAFKTRLLNTLGWLHAELGCDERAADFNQQSTELAAEMVKLELVPGAPELYGNAAVNLACNWIALGQLDAARDRLEAVRAEVDKTDDPWMLWRYSLHLWNAFARLELAAGDPDAARTWVSRELAGARETKARKLEARALELLGRVSLAQERSDEALQSLGQAHRLADEIGYHPVCWRADALLADLSRRNGDAAAAERHGEAAQRRIRSLASRLSEEVPRSGLLSLADRIAADPAGALR